MSIIKANNIHTFTVQDGISKRTYILNAEYNTETGETKIIPDVTTDVAGQKIKSILTLPVFINGWTSFSDVIPQEDKNKTFDNLKTKFLTPLSRDPKNKMPGFFTQNVAPAPNDGTGYLVDAAKALTSVPNLDDYNSSSMYRIFKPNGQPSLLKYPIDIIDQGQDVFEITQYTYRPPYYDVINNGQIDEVGERGIQRGSALKEKIASLLLPIPNNVSDTNATGWAGDSLDPISMSALGDMPKIAMLAANKAGNEAINSAIPGGGETISKLISLVGGSGIGAVANTLGNLSNIAAKNPVLAYGLLSKTAFNPTLRKALENLILQAAGFEIPLETVLSRGYGVVSNSNLELLFTGPTLRGFQFVYDMTPRDEQEAAMCRKILRFFKQGMAPKKNQKVAPGYGGPSFLLGTPNVFKLTYKTWDYKEKKYVNIEGLNRFKICALTNMNTSYAEGSWSAYEKGQPVRMRMQLAFKELEPVYESDYNKESAEFFNDRVQYQQQNQKEPVDAGQYGVKDEEIGY